MGLPVKNPIVLQNKVQFHRDNRVVAAPIEFTGHKCSEETRGFHQSE